MVAFRPNTRLGAEAQAWDVDDVVDVFLASPHYRIGGDVRRQLQFFITDQDGPIGGVCDTEDLVTLSTAVQERLAALVTAGKDTA